MLWLLCHIYPYVPKNGYDERDGETCGTGQLGGKASYQGAEPRIRAHVIMNLSRERGPSARTSKYTHVT
jgi:hypothetical protein